MPKIIELTVELEIQKVSCPGVWLCQDGRVSLTIFQLGTSYQTCALPPMFPLMFRDVFYFRKRFQESCALNNICCILKEETIYCELVQWSNDCCTGDCKVLAQYLGTLNDVLFPPNMCSNDGVDLLMRRSKDFPGILSPKIEIATKVRIDEVWDQPCNVKAMKVTECHCSRDMDAARQKHVCHTPQYHRSMCSKRPSSVAPPPRSRSRSRSRSQGSTRSCCSLTQESAKVVCGCPRHSSSPSPAKSRASLSHNPKPSRRKLCQYNVYNVETASGNWPGEHCSSDISETEDQFNRFIRGPNNYTTRPISLVDDNKLHKQILESRYIDHEMMYEKRHKENEVKNNFRQKVTPCVCEICRRYHELFHTNKI